MRRAEAHTCYLCSYAEDGNISYRFRNIGEADDSGYEDETYYVDANYIYNESAAWRILERPHLFDTFGLEKLGVSKPTPFFCWFPLCSFKGCDQVIS